jgi:hypothetical protein
VANTTLIRVSLKVRSMDLLRHGTILEDELGSVVTPPISRAMASLISPLSAMLFKE